MADEKDVARQFDSHLRAGRQVWLLGAGVSRDANVPLMYPLTERVLEQAKATSFAGDQQALGVVAHLKADLSDDMHIEHMLSHLSDLNSLAERSRDGAVRVDGLADKVGKDKLRSIHNALLDLIRETIRWGYRPAEGGQPAKIGEPGEPIVDVSAHRQFVSRLYRASRAGVEGFRAPLEFITTNYDTLLEDALALEHVAYVDGFLGGAVARWDEAAYNATPSFARAVVIKIHGSIDWFRAEDGDDTVYRVRHGDLYPKRTGAVVIYPQATKYTASRQDPFGWMFQRFRDSLAPESEKVFFTCGYSFGDDHINADIEAQMRASKSRTTLLAFVKERDNKLPVALDRLRNAPEARARTYIATERGLYRGQDGPFFPMLGGERDWWTFAGLTKLIGDGLPSDIAEALQ